MSESHDCTEDVTFNETHFREIGGRTVRVEIGECDVCGARVGTGWVRAFDSNIGGRMSPQTVAERTVEEVGFAE